MPGDDPIRLTLTFTRETDLGKVCTTAAEMTTDA